MRKLAVANNREGVAMNSSVGLSVILTVRVEGKPALTMERAQMLRHRFTFPLEEVLGEVKVRASFNGKFAAEGILVSLGEDGVGVTFTNVAPLEDWMPENLMPE